MYMCVYIVHQKHHLSRSFLQKKACKTTKILEIRLADISSLLVKDLVRATDNGNGCNRPHVLAYFYC